MSVNSNENTNDPRPSPSERGDALRMIKKFAHDAYHEAAATDEGFEELWQTAFNIENLEPNPTSQFR